MLKTILFSFMFGVLFSYIFNVVLRFLIKKKYDNKERYRIKSIEHTLNQISKAEKLHRRKITYDEASRLLMEYSMHTDDVCAADRNVSRIIKLSNNDKDIMALGSKAKDIIHERLAIESKRS